MADIIIPPPHTAGASECLTNDCTPDELAALIREMRDSSGLIRAHTYHLVTYKNCFIGKDFVTWLVEKKGLSCKCNGVSLEILLTQFVCVKGIIL